MNSLRQCDELNVEGWLWCLEVPLKECSEDMYCMLCIVSKVLSKTFVENVVYLCIQQMTTNKVNVNIPEQLVLHIALQILYNI